MTGHKWQKYFLLTVYTSYSSALDRNMVRLEKKVRLNTPVLHTQLCFWQCLVNGNVTDISMRSAHLRLADLSC